MMVIELLDDKDASIKEDLTCALAIGILYSKLLFSCSKSESATVRVKVIGLGSSLG